MFKPLLLFYIIAISACQSSYLKTSDYESVTESEIKFEKSTGNQEITLTEATTFTAIEIIDNLQVLNETKLEENSLETEPVEVPDDIFRLKMTIVERWSNDFLDKKSERFRKLGSNLGSHLIDLIDNSKESIEPNITQFKLVEVQPSKGSAKKVYVTFIASSKLQLSKEDLHNAITNRIILYGDIYEYEATMEGFSLEIITKEEASEYDDVLIVCDTGKETETLIIEII